MHLLSLRNIQIDSDKYTLEYDRSKLNNLHDLLLYSPRAIDNYEKILFILYQLLKFVRFLHSLNLNLGELKLDHIYIDENYWIRLKLPIETILDLYKTNNTRNKESEMVENTEDINDEDEQKLESQIELVSSPREIKQYLGTIYDSYRHLNHKDLANVTKNWCINKISNFDYLLILNCIAGRLFSTRLVI